MTTRNDLADVVPPPDMFAARARLKMGHLSKDAWNAEHIDAYWAKAAQQLRWMQPYRDVVRGTMPEAQWFVGGMLNASDNCIDRHLKKHGNKAAIVWEGEPLVDGRAEVRTLTYQQLHHEVCRATSALRALGIKRGDRVAVYMPLVPEAVVAMLACARVGAIHSVVFGGFSAEALRDRINDAGAKLVITADGGHRRGAVLALKHIVDDAVRDAPTVEHVLVVKRTGAATHMHATRDVWWHEVLATAPRADAPEAVDAEHPLFILYTSGTTGKPKGVVHSTGGYLVGAMRSFRYVFDYKNSDLFWCSADVGWITGHSYVVYGPLLNGASIFLYEGAPMHPAPDRFWDMIERHRISVLYTAPTAIRTFMRMGDEHVAKHDLSSLRLLGSVGEPINPEAWRWYHRVVGNGRCPIVDTWWQTETGSIVCTPLPGITHTKPGSCMSSLPGFVVDVVRKDGTSCGANEEGLLVIKRAWPSMMRTIWRDPERFVATYFSQLKDPASGAPWYFTGDGARRDDDGSLWVIGRVDDVLNVSGHRLGTAELESALVLHPAVAEAAVVGKPDAIKGQAVVAFVTVKQGVITTGELVKELQKQVSNEIGGFARPDEIRFAQSLPKTRSGKIMRRLLRELATTGRVVGDTTSLEDFSAVAALQQDD
jgi:acetyl-CoA synthetase